ncbi:CLUMA_CG001756, isoform A [Clunio marinus]|uniref:CLUMA_CG001756, isoform A n=1 Tax=Clunio marinus TaxID=568069 RepID=A0A1J1HKA1_9DIPT|nr:CLUMA_CG001756, isoform A [Clunio marinus]
MWKSYFEFKVAQFFVEILKRSKATKSFDINAQCFLHAHHLEIFYFLDETTLRLLLPFIHIIHAGFYVQ